MNVGDGRPDDRLGRAGGGVQLSSSGNFQFNRAKLFRPDLSPPVRTINMIRLGEALNSPNAGVGGPPVRALVVYNSNPVAGGYGKFSAQYPKLADAFYERYGEQQVAAGQPISGFHGPPFDSKGC